MAKNNQRLRISEENWRRLNALKRPGDNFNDVVGRLLDEKDVEQPADP